MRSGRKLLLLTTHLERGGTSLFLSLIHDELRARNLEPSIVALYAGRKELVDDRLAEKAHVLVPKEQLRLGYLALVPLMWRVMRQTDPGAVMGVQPAANLVGGLSAIALGVPRRICAVHASTAYSPKPLRWLDGFLRSAGLYSHVVCVSRELSGEFSNKPRVQVIANGIGQPTRVMSTAEVRRRYGLPQDKPVLSMIGRLIGEKNVLNAVCAACSRPELYLAVAGDGPLRPELEEIITRHAAQSRVRLLGNLEHQEAIDLLMASDGFVQPSRTEGRSIALLEALASRIPILVSDVPAQREAVSTVSGELAALLCDVDDIAGMAGAMSRLAYDRALRDELRRRLETSLSLPLDIKTMADAYARLLADDKLGAIAWAN